jgi:hypothetical protein
MRNVQQEAIARDRMYNVDTASTPALIRVWVEQILDRRGGRRLLAMMRPGFVVAAFGSVVVSPPPRPLHGTMGEDGTRYLAPMGLNSAATRGCCDRWFSS